MQLKQLKLLMAKIIQVIVILN